MAKDITLRRRALEAQEESERRFQTLVEQAGVGIGEVDSATGRYLQINQSYCDIVGKSKEELLGSTFQPLTYPEDLAASLALMEELRAGRIQKAALEKRYIRKDGKIVWVNIQIAKMTGGRHSSPSHISVVQDITARKQSEKEIQDQLEELRRWQEATLGREARILSLKREVNKLRVSQGLAPRYSSALEEEGSEPPAP
jgi:PAS domain S-box-containing protein